MIPRNSHHIFFFYIAICLCMIRIINGGTASHLIHLSKDERKKAEAKARPAQEQLHKYREQIILSKDKGQYISEYHIVKDLLNPSIMQLNASRVFICWRTGMLRGSYLQYGWIDLDQLSKAEHTQPSSKLITNKNDFPHIPYFDGLGGVPRQNEARILVLPNGRISFTYAGNVKYQPVTQHVSFARLDEAQLRFEQNVYWMKYADDQKNWVPFEYHGEIYFVQQFQPMHVITIDSKQHSTRLSSTVSMKTIARSLNADQLPWNTTLFGKSIRGGTQAILLPNQQAYLAIFHTSVINPPHHVILTYFMGALTFNATPPFNILSMSEVPIYKPDIYQGTWSRPGLDYVVFPTSMFLSPDNQYLWVGAGYQDRDGLIMKLHLQDLLATLKPVVSGNKI